MHHVKIGTDVFEATVVSGLKLGGRADFTDHLPENFGMPKVVALITDLNLLEQLNSATEPVEVGHHQNIFIADYCHDWSKRTIEEKERYFYHGAGCNFDVPYKLLVLREIPDLVFKSEDNDLTLPVTLNVSPLYFGGLVTGKVGKIPVSFELIKWSTLGTVELSNPIVIDKPEYDVKDNALTEVRIKRNK